MSIFPKMTLTNKGKALEAKLKTGDTIEFTRMGLGSGELNKPIAELLNLINETLSVSVSSPKIIEEYTVQLRVFFTNANVQERFFWRESGLFANDPDEGEILYAYSNAGDMGGWIPAATDNRAERLIYVSVQVSNAQEINITITQSDTFIPTSEKGVADGVASLDSSGKIPESQLPELDFIPNDEKGQPNGVAELGEDGKIPEKQLPDSVPKLDEDGKLPVEQLPKIETIPTGAVMWYANSNVPDGFLVCDGSAISRTTYSTLFNVIGTTFGSGNGSTTFNLPNIINKYLKGSDIPKIGNSGSTINYYRYDYFLALSIENPLTQVSTDSYMTRGQFIGNESSRVSVSNYTLEPPNVCLIPCIKY